MPSSIAECYSQIRQYQELSKDIANIISKINACADNFKKLDETLVDNYNINGNTTPVYDRLSELDKEASKTSNYLNNTIIPAINSAISDLYRRIAELEAEAAAAAEAEAKAKAEAQGN